MPAQLTVRERHGEFDRLACYAVGGAHTWDKEWEPYSPAEVRYVMEYYRHFGVMYRTLLRRLPHDGEIVEAGSGLGFWVALLAEAGFRACGMDVSEEALEQARRTFPGLRFERGDVRELPFSKASLSGYVSFGVAEHFREGPDVVLREAARVLRPGGVLILSVPWISLLRRLEPRASVEEAAKGSFYQYFFERREIEERIARCGFCVVARTYYGAFKTLRDVIRGARRSASVEKREKPSAPSRPRVVPHVDLKRKLFWGLQNAVFENPLSRRVAGHMILVVAERIQA